MPRLQNINTREVIEGVATQDYADRGYVPVSDTTPLFTPPLPASPSNLNLPGITGSGTPPISDGTANNQGANKTALGNMDGSIGLIDPLEDKNVAARATEIEQARNAINTQTQADLDAINNAGIAAGLEYNSLIATAEEEKRQGMGSAIVTAGRRGGLENTQFAGQAAAVVTPEALAALETLKRQGFDVQLPDRKSWVGEGGKLESIQKVFSANITRLQDLQKQAIAAARSAAMKYQRDGKIENYNIAKDLYEQAKGLIKDSNDLKIQRAEMERNIKNDAFTKERAKISDDLAQNQFDFEKYKYKYEIEHPTVKTSWAESVDSKDDLMHKYLVDDTGKIIQDLGATENLVTEMAKKYKDANIIIGMGGDTLAQATAKLKNSKIYQEEIKTNTKNFEIKTVKGEDVLFNPATGEIKSMTVNIASGDIVTNNIGGRDIKLDSVASPSLNIINQQALDIGGLRIGATATSSLRTTQQQQELYDAYLKGGPQAAKPGTSAHEKGLALDLYPDQAYIKKMKPIMEANGWAQNAGNNDLGHFEYVGKQNNQFDYFSKEQIALSVIPTQLRNSDTELKRYQQGIKEGLAKNMSPYEIADTLMGYKIDKPDAFSDRIRELMSQIPTLNNGDPSNFARLINAGDKAGVIKKIETAMTKDIIDYKVRETTARYTYEMAPKIYQEINKIEKDFGLVAGNWNKLKKKVTASTDFQKVASELASYVQEWRKGMVGSQVTQVELDMINELLPSVTDNPVNLKQKIKSFAEMQLNVLNANRGTVNLPSLDYNSLFDYNNRVSLYGNEEDPLGLK
jgi:hypothetical protein